MSKKWNGDYWIGVDEQIVMIRLANHWSEILTLELKTRLQKTLKTKDYKKIAIIFDARKLLSDQTIDPNFHIQGLDWLNEIGIVDVVEIYPCNQCKESDHIGICNRYLKRNFNWKLICSLPEAIEYLGNLGYKGYSTGKYPVKIIDG